ncbi:MAG: hypothetical protein OEO79_02805 [Gemmatimonadota bacterium]|nr:hypothetical protein [Gemmatimonadota bacterium]
MSKQIPWIRIFVVGVVIVAGRSRLPLLVVALILAASPVGAQIQPGRIYTGGEQIGEPSLGLALTLPGGWRGALSPDGSSFLMESETGGGYMVVIAEEGTEAEARALMAEPLDVGDGVVLRPDGEVRQIASGHLSAGYTVTGVPTQMVGTVDVRLTQGGLAVAFILLSPPAASEPHLEDMRELALSLGVTDPIAQGAGGSDEWEPYMRGRYLARFYTQTGYTESTELWLCSDGSFYFNDQSGGFGGGASGAVQGAGNGRWSATGAGASGTLNLDWSGGGRSTWALEYDYDEDRLFVNGQRMLRGENERCS